MIRRIRATTPAIWPASRRRSRRSRPASRRCASGWRAPRPPPPSPCSATCSRRLGMTVRNDRFQLAVMNNTEPSAADVAAFEDDLKTGRVKLMVYNSQASDPVAMRMQRLARAAHVPVVGATETENRPARPTRPGCSARAGGGGAARMPKLNAHRICQGVHPANSATTTVLADIRPRYRADCEFIGVLGPERRRQDQPDARRAPRAAAARSTRVGSQVLGGSPGPPRQPGGRLHAAGARHWRRTTAPDRVPRVRRKRWWTGTGSACLCSVGRAGRAEVERALALVDGRRARPPCPWPSCRAASGSACCWRRR